jgi:hypothetical protein
VKRNNTWLGYNTIIFMNKIAFKPISSQSRPKLDVLTNFKTAATDAAVQGI